MNRIGFKRLMAAVEPRYTIPSDKYFSDTLIPDMYEKVKGKLLTAAAGQISTAKRNRLAPVNVERLLFLHENLRLLNFDY